MRILFFHPEKYLNSGIPAGIATLSAIIKRQGHEVDLFDTTFLKVAADDVQHLSAVNKSDSNLSAGDNVLANTEIEITRSSAACMKHFMTIGFEEEQDFNQQLPDTEPAFWNNTSGEGSRMLFKPTPYTINDLVKDDPIVKREEIFQAKIDNFKPDVLALSCMTTAFDFAVDLLNKVDLKGALVIAGGVHATIAPMDILAQEKIDVAAIGEADETFPELLNLMQKGEDYTNVKSMIFKLADGTFKENSLAQRPELDKLPTPDWDIFDKRHLFRPFEGKIYKGSFYSQSRGCPMACTYCVDPTISEVTGGKHGYFRYQSPETSFRQLSELKSRYGATWLKFCDDTFLLPPVSHLEQLRDLIKPLNIMFGCSIMPNTIRENKVDLAREMGCVAMSVGIESGDPVIRKQIMRHYENEELVKRLRMIIAKGIRVSTFNIIGFPGESREQMFKTIEINRQIGTNSCSVYVLYPYPGTPIAIEHNIPLRDINGKIPDQDTGADLGLSQLPGAELRAFLMTFNHYLILNKTLWPIVRFAEGSSACHLKIHHILSAFIIGLLNQSRFKTASISRSRIALTMKRNDLVDFDIPKILLDLFDNRFTEQQNLEIYHALYLHFVKHKEIRLFAIN